MYEMEGPRLVSRRRPADCSASIAPLDHLPGPVAWPAFRSPETPVAQGSPSRGGSEFLRRSPGVAPKATAESLFAGWVRVFSLPKARGCPSADGSSSSSPGGSGCRPWPVTRGFTLCRVARVSSCQRPAVIPCRWLRGFPRRRVARGRPLAGGSGCPCAEGPRSSLAGGSGPPVPVARNALCRVAPNPPLATARGCPLTGDLEFPLRRWPGVSPWPGGSGFPLRLLPFPVVRKFLRLSSGPHKRFPLAISRFFRRPQAIHS
jgi:hypothetical protein